MCLSGPTHEISVREYEDDDFMETVPRCVSSRPTEGDHGNEIQEGCCAKETSTDEFLMKAVRAFELYGFEDVEPSFHSVLVNDNTVDDIDFTLADSDIFVERLFNSKQEVKISLDVYSIKKVFRFQKHVSNYVAAKCIDKTCKFYVTANQMGEASTYQVRKAIRDHVCTSDVRGSLRNMRRRKS